MKTISLSPSLTEQVYQAILNEVLEGRLQPGEHLVQEQLAANLGVSRQPIQQAMALLKADGVVEEVGKRGLRVANLDLGKMQCHYDIRCLLDGYAAKRAALAVRSGAVDVTALRAQFDEIFKAGAEAIRTESVQDQILHDQVFHKLTYELSGNSVLQETSGPNWRYLRRVMAAVLLHAEPATDIWEQHHAIADAILAGNEDTAGTLAESHVRTAAERLTEALHRKSLAAQNSSVA